jgi:putative Mg2+ transporter-C (MgtC) family protein
LGAAIGIEREMRHKPAGLRTNILITLGAAIFTSLSSTLVDEGGSADRIVSQIVTGVGFLGGGAILRTRGAVHGMTTAATIWVNAGIGAAAGAGRYGIALVGTLITLVVLAALQPLEQYFERRSEGS